MTWRAHPLVTHVLCTSSGHAWTGSENLGLIFHAGKEVTLESNIAEAIKKASPAPKSFKLEGDEGRESSSFPDSTKQLDQSQVCQATIGPAYCFAVSLLVSSLPRY
jgi:hypothetical protein